MYEMSSALESIDASPAPILMALLITAGCAFLYFFVAIKKTHREKTVALPLTAAALFFWHDLHFVLLYDFWFNQVDHWWVKLWWFALCGTVPIEMYMIYLAIRFSYSDYKGDLSALVYSGVMLGAVALAGALWWLIKSAIDDDLFFLSFAVTAVWATPFNTAALLRNQSTAGQSAILQLAVITMILSMTVAFSMASPSFLSAPFLCFVLVYVLAAIVNIKLIQNINKKAKKL